jgi:hypothetical protein
MFDEVSEGTQIVKVTNSPPTQAPNTVTYEGMPSDAYLCFTSQGSQMLKGTIPASTALPNCPAMTQPTIPDPIAPLDGANAPGPAVGLSWTAAMALAGGGSLTSYETWIDGTVQGTSSLALSGTTSLSPGTHVWRVRAVNSLGNRGGWSVAQTFTVGTSAGDAGTVADAGAMSAMGDAGESGEEDAAAGTAAAAADGGVAEAQRASSGCGCVEAGGEREAGATWGAIAGAIAIAGRRARRRGRSGRAERRD